METRGVKDTRRAQATELSYLDYWGFPDTEAQSSSLYGSTLGTLHMCYDCWLVVFFVGDVEEY